METIIIKNISDLYTVMDDTGCYDCKAKGVFRNKNITPTVGDKVLFDKEQKVITKILDRKNILVRPPVANIDIAIIVMIVVNPEFSTNLVDKLINIIEYNNIKPVLCLSKLDLLKNNKDEIDNIIAYYKSIGYLVLLNTEINKIKKLIDGKVVVLTGQSGVGKSSLLNRLDASLELKTNDISYALGRGKHTTRHTELIPIFGGFIADTPGFSSLSFINMTKEDIKNNFVEFKNYTCKYRDCMHIKEDDCSVKNAVKSGEIMQSRYDNYVKFISEIKSIY